MKFSKLRSSSVGSKDIGAFYGLNRTNRINDAQVSECKNMDCEAFPYFATRRHRELFYGDSEKGEKRMAVICHDTDIEDDYKVTGITVDGNFVYRGSYIGCGGQLAGNDYICEYLGDYVCFPGKQVVTSFQTYSDEAFIPDVYSFDEEEESSVYFECHTAYTQHCGEFRANGAKGEFTVACDEWGANFDAFIKQGKLSEGMCFVPVLRKSYNNGTKTQAVERPDGVFLCVDFIQNDAANSKMMFTFYDKWGVEFDYGKWLSDSGISFPLSVNFDGSNALVSMGTGQVVSGGVTYYQVVELQLDYISPPMLMGASFGGRLFACDMFGVDVFYSSVVDKYDFTPGTSLGDAGSVQCADHGRWTAIIPYGGVLYAFKRNGMYRIYSSDGLNFYMEKVADVGAVGAQAVCVVSDVMFFLSETGFYKFTGSYPAEISDTHGRRYVSGVLGGYDNMLYASVLSSDGVREMLVYNASIGAYGVHDDFNAKKFLTYGGKLYAHGEDGYVYDVIGEREAVEFSFCTRKFFLSFEKKAVNGIRMYFDFSGGENEELKVSVSYDGGEWEDCVRPITSGKVKYVPIKFKKCDEFMVKVEGRGVFTLKGLTLSLYSGGDVKQNR